MEGPNSNFVELKWDEISDSLADLVSAGGAVKIWAKGEVPDLCTVTNSHSEDTDQQLRLKNSHISEEWLEKDFYIQFDLQSVEYFSKGKVVEILEDNEFWFEMNPHVFRVEKRENPRVQTYPNFQVYAYFKVSQDSAGDNLVFINKHIEENHKIFKKFKKLTEKEILEVQDSTDVDKSNNEILGFRVLDLSANGISFLTNKKESEYFVDNQSYEMTLSFEGDVYHLSNAKLVYNVDYVNPRAGNVAMYKIGLSFDRDENFAKRVDELEARQNDGGQVLKDFENFAE